MWVVVDVVHSAVVYIVSVFDGEPRVLFDLLIVLPGFHVDDIELGGLLVVDALLVHDWHVMLTHHSLSVIR